MLRPALSLPTKCLFFGRHPRDKESHQQGQISAQAGCPRILAAHQAHWKCAEMSWARVGALRSACLLTKRSEAANVRPGRQVLVRDGGVARPIGDAYEGIAQSHA